MLLPSMQIKSCIEPAGCRQHRPQWVRAEKLSLKLIDKGAALSAQKVIAAGLAHSGLPSNLQLLTRLFNASNAHRKLHSLDTEL